MTAEYTVGDVGVSLEGTCKKQVDDVLLVSDLTGATLELHLRPPGVGASGALVRVAQIVSEVDGTWSYTFAEGDLTIAGSWKGEIQAQDTGGTTVETYGPFEFRVRKQLA